jgi:hypothetical protein
MGPEFNLYNKVVRWSVKLKLARTIQNPRREVVEMPVMARKTSEPNGGVFGAYVEDRQARMTPPAPADASPQQRAYE